MSLDIRPLRASAPLSLRPLQELERGRLLSRSRLPLPAPLPRLLLPAHHSTLGNVMSREKFRWTAPFLDPPVFPDLWIEEQGRIVELALGRTALVTVAVALVPLTVRGRERRRLSSSRSLSSRERSRRERSRSSDRSRSWRMRSRSRGDRIDTCLAGTALGVTVRGLLTATGHVDSMRVPLLAVIRSPSPFS